MLSRLLALLAVIITFTPFAVASGREKPRVLVLTDIENEPDDAMSMVRFLTYSNQWDVEGIIATTSVHQKKEVAAWRIREIVGAYGKVQPNLLKHEPGYPTEEYLLSVIKEGRADYGMHAVGEGMDSEGSDWIIKTVDKDDKRPVWVLVWGGPNCLAQALWKVRNTRTQAETDAFVDKLRVYAISDQDDSGPWIRQSFRDLFYIVSPDTISSAAIIMERGAVLAATGFTDVSPGLISRLWITPGWIRTYVARDRLADSIRR